MTGEDSTQKPSRHLERRVVELEQKNAELHDLVASLRDKSIASFLDNLPGMAYRCRNDRDRTMEFNSGGSLELTGYAPHELENNTKAAYGSLIHEDDRRHVWDEVQRAVKKDRTFRLVYRIIARDGEEKWVWEQGRGIRDDKGELLFVEGFIVDTSESKKTEDALQASEERYRKLVELCPDGICIYCNERLVFANRTAMQLYGVKGLDQWLDSSIFSFIHPDYHDVVRKRITQLEEEGTLPLVEEKFVAMDGAIVDVEVSSRHIRYGNQQGMLVVFRDISQRKRSERQLLEALSRFESVIENTPLVGIQGFDRDGVIRHWNKASVSLFGTSREEALGRRIQDVLMHGEQVQDFERRLESVWSTAQASEPFEWQLEAADGVLRWVYSILFPVVVDGETREVFQMDVDITSRKLAEEQLNRTRNLLESVVINLPTAVFLKDAKDLRFLMWNRANEELLGIKASEVLGKTDYDLFPKEQASFFETMDRQTIASGQLQDIPEETISTRSRGVRTLHTRKIPILEGDAPLYLLGISEDITERKEAEETLRESEEKYHKLYEGFPNAIFVETPEGEIIDCNWSAGGMFRYPKSELVGKNMKELLPDESAVQLPRDPDAAPTYVEVSGRRKSGEMFFAEVGVRHVVIQGRPLGLVHVRDVTERKQAEEERRRLEAQILQAQKLESLGILAGGIAHDFNNLLTAILGYADLAILEMPAKSPYRENLEQIAQTARRASDLTKQMLAYSGRGRFSIQPLDLSHVVFEMAHLLEVSISKKCEIRYRFAKDIPAIEADVAQIRQVIMNLIINASEAIDDNTGTVTVSTGSMFCQRDILRDTYLNENLKEGQYVYLEVSDTGSGMTFETRTRLFDPFYTTKFTGRGLGLAAVLGIVRGHSGAIQVQGEPGKGTTFKVFFPASGVRAQVETEEKKQVESGSGSGTVLIVDDEEIVRELAEKMLERAGYNVLLASDGQECINMLKDTGRKVDIILLDMTMPRMSGEETFKEIRKLGLRVPVILTSGYSAQDVTARFPRGSFAGFIQKPFVLQQLSEMVQKTLKQKKR